MNDPRSKRPYIKEPNNLSVSNPCITLKLVHSIKVKEKAEKRIAKIRAHQKSARFLSNRELEVLRMIALGWSSLEVSTRMGISHHTVTNHRKNMLNRSRCGNIPELVRVAIHESLL